MQFIAIAHGIIHKELIWHNESRSLDSLNTHNYDNENVRLSFVMCIISRDCRSPLI